jgi:DNA-binding transcriptional LysR family regulator
MTLRLGIQQDIAAVYLGDLVAELRKVFPQTAFYIEPDYSAQMCADLSSGAQDFAVLFTPKMHPDLYFASAGEIPYRLVSSDCAKRADIKVDGYISGHFSPAFDQAHAQLLPELVTAPLSVGQSSAIFNLLQSLGGTGFVMEQQAKDMVASGRFSFVEDVQTIHQPIYAAMHLRHRISKAHRRMTSLVQRKLGGKTA